MLKTVCHVLALQICNNEKGSQIVVRQASELEERAREKLRQSEESVRILEAVSVAVVFMHHSWWYQ